jgi:hypothetical protein
MTLNEIRSSIATYLKRDVNELNVNDVDLGLVAMNQVRTNAELSNDFGFTQMLLTLSVDGVTGGSLDDVVEQGGDPEVHPTIKTIIDVGTFDSNGVFVASEWTVAEDYNNRVRELNPYFVPRYPTDAQAVTGMYSGRGFVFAGNRVRFSQRAVGTVLNLGILAYVFTPDWSEADLDDANVDRYDNVWNRQGSEYLMWGSVIHLNHVHKEFVFRQEGNLPPPEKLAETALGNLVTWDNFRYQQFRRHRR